MMKIFNKTKKIILIWDYDAPIGQINATFPYNFDYNTFNKEKSNVEYALNKMDEYSIKKSCENLGNKINLNLDLFKYTYLVICSFISFVLALLLIIEIVCFDSNSCCANWQASRLIWSYLVVEINPSHIYI